MRSHARSVRITVWVQSCAATEFITASTARPPGDILHLSSGLGSPSGSVVLLLLLGLVRKRVLDFCEEW